MTSESTAHKIATTKEEWLERTQLLTANVVLAAQALDARIRVLPDGGLVTVPALEAKALREALAERDEWISSIGFFGEKW